MALVSFGELGHFSGYTGLPGSGSRESREELSKDSMTLIYINLPDSLLIFKQRNKHYHGNKQDRPC